MMFAILRGRDAAMRILKEQHNFHGYAAAQETVDFVKKYREHFIGFDFAAAENALPATDLVPIVEQVKKMRLHLTCHSGEGSSVENIRTMVSLYEPERLGHGMCDGFSGSLPKSMILIYFNSFLHGSHEANRRS
jgi:hypothetical protein